MSRLTIKRAKNPNFWLKDIIVRLNMKIEKFIFSQTTKLLKFLITKFFLKR